MLAFVHEKAGPERNQTQEALEALSKQLELANRMASRFRTSLPNRDEAISELPCEPNESASETRRYLGIFVADVLSALRVRHGNEISDQLLHEVGQQHIFPLLPGGKVFRWSAQSVLTVWHSRKESAQVSAALADACQAPFDCRAFVGTRTATFRIAVRFLVLEAQPDTAGLVRAFDDFSKGIEAK